MVEAPASINVGAQRAKGAVRAPPSHADACRAYVSGVTVQGAGSGSVPVRQVTMGADES